MSTTEPKERPGVMLYFDAWEPLSDLTEAERGRMLDAVITYAKSGEEPQLSGSLKIAWGYLRTKIDRDGEAWKEKQEKARRSAYAGPWKRYAEKHGLDKDDADLRNAWIDEQIALASGRKREQADASERYPTTTTTSSPSSYPSPKGKVSPAPLAAGEREGKGEGEGPGEGEGKGTPPSSSPDVIAGLESLRRQKRQEADFEKGGYDK